MIGSEPKRRIPGWIVLLVLCAFIAALGSVIWFGAGR